MTTPASTERALVPVLKWPLLAGTAILLVVCLLLTPNGLPPEGELGYMLRVTARVAFVLLMLAYLASPLMRLFRRGRTLVRNRRYLGLSMALAHTVHFGYVVALFVYLGEWPDVVTLVGGGLAFVLMWLMAATSNDAAMRWLGATWGRLHTFGMHYLWIIFMNSFIGRLGDDPYFIYAGLVALGLTGLILRAWAFARRRAQRESLAT